MTRRNESQLESPRELHRRPILTAAFSLAFAVIGLLTVAGCGHPVAATPMEQALADFDGDDWDAAIASCDKAIALDPENSAAYLLRGRAQHLAGRLDQAVVDLTEAIRLNPQDPEAYYQRANAYRALGKMDLKDEDNMSARQHDPTYESQFQTDGPMGMDPAIIGAEPETKSKKKLVAKEPGDLEADADTPAATDEQPKRSIVEEMLGMPPDLLERDRLTSSRTQPPESPNHAWPSLTEPDNHAGANRGLGGQESGVGNAKGSKSSRGQAANGRMAPLPADRGGLAGGNDRPPADDRRGQQAGTRQRGTIENRNLNPYGPSAMRPTGIKDPAAYFVDPRTGLPAGQGRAATVGSPYVAPNPYAPVGQTPGVGAYRTSPPPRPLFPPPPGNRYDGGRGYGN